MSALSHLATGQRPTKALYTAQKAIHSSPTSAYAWCGLAACLGAKDPASGVLPEDEKPLTSVGYDSDADEPEKAVTSSSVLHAEGEIPKLDTLVSLCHGKSKCCCNSPVHGIINFICGAEHIALCGILWQNELSMQILMER